MNNDKKNKIEDRILKDYKTWILLAILIISLISLIPQKKKQEVKKNNSNDEKIDYDLVDYSNLIENIPKENISKENKYKVKVHINFESNLVFSKYDVILKSDDKKVTLKHGEDEDIELELTKGERKLTFVDADDSSIETTMTINVTSNMEVGYRINCHYDRVTVKELYVDKDEKLLESQIKIDFDKSKFDSKNYKDVIKDLSDLGFINIEEKPLYDIVFNITSEGEIEDVLIDGKTDYRKGDVFNKDTKVVVSYHMKDDDDPTRIKAPYDGDTARKLNYKEVVDAFKKAGFTNVTTNSESTSDSSKDGVVSTIIIGYTHADLNTSYKSDEKVEINYYYYKAKNESKDDYGDSKHEATAKRAFENMGKSLYPYGIKFHWWVGLRDFTYKGNGLWYIEVEVTITNKDKTKTDAVAYGYVDFIGEKVKEFKIKKR